MPGVSLADSAADALRERILSGDIAAGSVISQSQVARDLGISRIPIRDAMFLLASEGLLVLQPGSGAVVQPLSVEDLQDIYELRGAVEPLASRIGLAHVGRSDIVQMRRLHGAMPELSTAEWLAANIEFHALLYRRSRRARMIQLIDKLRTQTERYLRLHLTVIGHTEHLHEEHAAILAAAEADDGAGVEEHTRRHLDTSHEMILTYLLDRGLDGPAPRPFDRTSVRPQRRSP